MIVHPYSSVNLKREDLKTILYDNIELPWGYLSPHTENFNSTQSLTKSEEVATPMSSRAATSKITKR